MTHPKRRTRSKTKKITPVTLFLVIVISLVTYFSDELKVQPATTLPQDIIAQVQVLDVGQGSSLLLRATGQTRDYAILIDTGERSASQAVADALDSAGIKQLDLLVITHPHTDHYGGAIALLEKYQVDELWMPNVPEELIPTNSTYNSLLDAIESNGCEVAIKVSPEIKPFGEQVTLSLLDAFLPAPDNLNNTSLCLRIDAGAVSFLVTGDGEVAVEDLLRENNQPIDVDIFVAGHHGSNTSNKQYFLNEVRPLATAISVGRDNSYNLPNEKALTRLSAFGPVYRTDLNATITFSTDGSTIWITADNIADQINTKEAA